jgi:hypothetical protein
MFLFDSSVVNKQEISKFTYFITFFFSQVSDYEKIVDDLNVWVEGSDKALAELDKNEIENNYSEAKRQFDVSKYQSNHSRLSSGRTV